ncbi:hypothetical protein MARCHEWKA_05610 [Brevundimonas phage vB_BpoS-Marchewka]|uniref:DUF2460 domain-containing protein n=1 Tax=Brevundimonas phage vB_BpoS-Marchewka TaxID=2948604 RepID=A0A9E7N4R8_9CAUD|nr:hypothetical protein MARCHEWKA_05610 [Brevundimonas phage vB_BpoS-Marchewka]UTC29510.1 hypothetical protein BAMBUS_04310 [Brevundimonas phage vB_BpoS-Bambus]
MAFHEVLFPTEISYGSSGGPKFKTTIFTADSGYEQRNIDWSMTRAEYDVSHGIKSQEQMDELTAFFYARRGRAFGFRFKDYNDFRLKQQVIALGDGVQTEFQIIKTYNDQNPATAQNYVYQRKLYKIAWNTVAGVKMGAAVQVQGVDYTIDHDTGKIIFAVPPLNTAPIMIGAAEFHVPVRFDTDHLDSTHEFWLTQSWSSIPLVEVRDWNDLFQG